MIYEITKLSRIGIIAIFFVILMAIFAGCAPKIASKQKNQAAEKPLEPKLITDIRISDDSESVTVSVKGNRLLTYTSVKRPFPLGVILYFPETALGSVKSTYTPDNDIIGSIKVSELTEKGHTSRIVISLKKDVPYEVTREGTGLKLSFSKTSKVKSSLVPKEIKKKKLNRKSDIKPDKNATVIHVGKNTKILTKDNPTQPAWINRIDFSSEDAGKSTIIIGTTKPVQYDIKKTAKKRLLLKLFNAKLPDYRQRPLITTRFESAVDRITPVQTPAMKNSSLVTIELREAVPYFVEQTDNLLLIHFEASSIPPKPFEEAKLPSWKKIMAQTTAAETEVKEKDLVDEEIPFPEKTKRYAGEKIALDFFDTDIKNVFRILMDVSGKNFAVDKNVTGKITLTLEKPVPWDQVLDLILKMNQLGKVSEGDIIRIATFETLKKEEENRRAKITAEQEIKEKKKALEPLITEYISVNYSNAKNEILPHVEKIITKDRGSISVDERTNIIIMTDVAKKIKQAKEIVRKLDRVTPQVIIEARIVEASTNFSREIGTQWGTGIGVQSSDLLDVGGLTDTVTNSLNDRVGVGPQRGYDNLGGTYGYNMAMNFPVSTDAIIGFNFVRIAGTPFLLNAKLMAMESQGEGKIISAPKIVTLDNKKATIKQGVRYPYITFDEAGNAVTEFENIDLVLEVTPHVTPDHRISMNINITKNDLGIIINNQQSFTTKEAQTELLINDGDTVVIGGIIKTTKRFSESGLPGVSKIPIIGWLFKSRDKTDDKEELLIFITPRIVQLNQRNIG